MGDSNPSILETRRDQVLPHLDTTDIERARRFGEVRRFALGDTLAKVGEVGIGLAIILSGQVDVYRYEAHGVRQHFYTFGPGSFLGELAQLAGRPSFGDAVASELVEALVFPRPMRALLIAEADLGEAAHACADLRRTQMLQDGVGGPVIVGRSENPKVLRLEGFLARNGTPRMRLDPDNDPEAKALIDRFHVDPECAPKSSVRADRSCTIRAKMNWHVASDWSARSIQTGSMMSPSSELDRQALPLPSTQHLRDFLF
jgi:thioredoxin reductase (NADPH)